MSILTFSVALVTNFLYMRTFFKARFRARNKNKTTELPECAGYRQFVRDLNPCVRGKLLMCGGAVFDSNVRDLVNLEFIK